MVTKYGTQVLNVSGSLSRLVADSNNDCQWICLYVSYFISLHPRFRSRPVKIKIIHAAWLRDRTWPAGAVAPEPDDVLPNGPSVPIPSFQSMSIPPIKDTPTLL